MKITIHITLRELNDNYDWNEICRILGFNPWCMSEGLATGEEEYELSEDQAREIGIIPSSVGGKE